MAASIDQAFVYEFSNSVWHNGQQKESRAMPCVSLKYGTADRFHWETLTNAEMTAKGSRLLATALTTVTHAKRYAAMSTFYWSEALDHNDAAKILIDPRSEYAKAGAMAWGRRIDDTILTAATAAAGTGLGGSSTTALPAGQQIGGTGGATGAGQKLTVGGLRKAKQLMDEAEVDEERYLFLSAKFLQDLLAVTEVVSSDYNTVKALVQGEVDTFLGFKFIRTERIVTNTGNRKWVIAAAKGSIGLGIAQGDMVRVAEDPAASFALRVYLERTLGAVRVEDKGVVALDCDTTA